MRNKKFKLNQIRYKKSRFFGILLLVLFIFLTVLLVFYDLLNNFILINYIIAIVLVLCLVILLFFANSIVNVGEKSKNIYDSSREFIIDISKVFTRGFIFLFLYSIIITIPYIALVDLILFIPKIGKSIMFIPDRDSSNLTTFSISLLLLMVTFLIIIILFILYSKRYKSNNANFLLKKVFKILPLKNESSIIFIIIQSFFISWGIISGFFIGIHFGFSGLGIIFYSFTNTIKDVVNIYLSTLNVFWLFFYFPFAYISKYVSNKKI